MGRGIRPNATAGAAPAWQTCRPRQGVWDAGRCRLRPADSIASLVPQARRRALGAQALHDHPRSPLPGATQCLPACAAARRFPRAARPSAARRSAGLRLPVSGRATCSSHAVVLDDVRTERRAENVRVSRSSREKGGALRVNRAAKGGRQGHKRVGCAVARAVWISWWITKRVNHSVALMPLQRVPG